MEPLSVNIYSYNKDSVGTLSVSEEGVRVALTGTEPIFLPTAFVRSATSQRIGKVVQSVYALRIFLVLQEAFRVRELAKSLELELDNGRRLNGSAICNVTGEYVEFFVNPTDVMGYDLKEKPVVRKIIDRINRVSDRLA